MEKESHDRVRTPEAEGGAHEASGQRDTFLHAFFKKGAQLADELLKENERLSQRVADLEAANASLRTQLASDDAIREALRKIEQLEREKHDLLSRAAEATASSRRSVARYVEVENDLAELANLYVAGDQLHSTLELARVTKLIRELLEQLVGARAHAVYYLEEATGELVPIATHGVDRERLAPVAMRGADPSGPAARAIEQAFLTKAPVIEPSTADTGLERPAACVPLVLDDRAIGVIVIYSLFAQKTALTTLDHELFRMLGAHAATALTGALLFAEVQGRLPKV
jgi:GAF domain-containing protein